MTEDEKKAAKGLAVAYQAIWEALDVPDEKRNRSTWNGVYCWAYMLRQSQKETGIELMSDASLQNHMDKASEEMARIDAIMHGSIWDDGISPV